MCIRDSIIRVLLEIHIAQEEAKHGFSPDECRELLYNLLPEALPYIRICGLIDVYKRQAWQKS